MDSEATRGILRDIHTLYTLGTMGGRTDAELLERFLTRGDTDAEDAFATLVARHGPMVFGVCRRMLPASHDTEDAFQATFLVLARRAASIVRRESVASWLYGVAVRTAQAARRRVARQRAGERRLMDETAKAKPEPAEDRDDLLPILDEELNRLPHRYRVALVACEIEGKPRREAARQLGIPEGTLSTHLARGRKLLRERLQQRGFSLGMGPIAGLAGPLEIAVPEQLIAPTVRAALVDFSAPGATAVATTAVSSLVERVLKMMFLARLSLLVATLTTSIAGMATAVALGWTQKATESPKAVSTRTARVDKTGAARHRYGDTLPEGTVARLGSSRVRGGDRPVNAMRFSPDGQTLLAALLPQSPASISLSGTVVDASEKPLSDLEVVLWARILAEGTAPTLARATTDAQGLFRFQVAWQPLPGLAQRRFFLAYPPGRAVAVQVVDPTRDAAPPPIRLTVAEPFRRTLTVLGPDDRPLSGVRLAPVLCAIDDTKLFQMPDDQLERFTIASGPDGVAAIPYFPSGIDPITVRVTAPGVVPHNLPLVDRPARDRITLKLGRPARLAGSVFDDSGQPAGNVPIEVWVEDTYQMPGDPNVHANVSPSLVRFVSGPVRTRPDGSFETPPQLLTGSSYRIKIRPEVARPITSDWLKTTVERTTFPPFRLKQQRRLRGLVHDRQGKPVAGARVFLPSGEPSTTTDAQGRYLLEGILPDKTYLLVKADGFRFHGWPAIPAREPGENQLILTRTSEPPERIMTPQPPAISPEEARALARRLLEPSLQDALAKGEDRPKWAYLRIASRTDPRRVLELLENHPFTNGDSREPSLRKMVATELLATDPLAAESIVKAIPGPGSRAWAYIELAAAQPDEARDQKRKLLELATVDVHDPAVLALKPEDRRVRLGQLVRGWLNLGDVDKARRLIREGLELVGVLPNKMPQFDDRFLSTAARLEPDRVLSIIGNLSSAADRRPYYARIVESLAIEHPAEAERVFQLTDDSPRAPIQIMGRIALQLRLCLRLAASDPERARRIIAGIEMPRDQAAGWALLALGLADRDKPAARTALAESTKVIDRLLDFAPPVKPDPLPPMAASNPAALILLIVEKVAPELLEEVFWKAVALIPNDDKAQKLGFADPRVGQAAIALARYDRQVAAVFVTQALSSLFPSRAEYGPADIRAKAYVDPQGAVALMQALPPGGDHRLPPNRRMLEARDELLIYLIEPTDHHWDFVWRQRGIDFDERSFP